MKFDFIIVGQGIAGTSFAFELLQRNKSFIIVDKYRNNSSSRVALGIYNPLVLKWLTKVWNIEEKLSYFSLFYHSLSSFLKIKIDYNIGLYKFLDTIYHQNSWTTKSISSGRSQYMSQEFYKLDNPMLRNNKPYGLVKNAGRIDIKLLLDLFRKYCVDNNQLISEQFNYSDIKIKKDTINFKEIQSDQIIFCEGNRLNENPYFNYLNLKPTKGEVLTIYSKQLKLNKIIHLGGLLVPLGNHYYSVGSTYDWIDINNYSPTTEGKENLISILNKIITCEYTIIDHTASLRPSTIDRRALIGSHKQYKNMYILILRATVKLSMAIKYI